MRKLLLPLLCCLLLAGCAPRAIAPRSGVYRMSAPPETVIAPSLTLDTEGNTFLFSYDVLSSFLPIGTFAQEDDVIICTGDATHTYLFRVVNETTLAFIEKGSSPVTLTDERIGAPVADGSVFLLD